MYYTPEEAARAYRSGTFDESRAGRCVLTFGACCDSQCYSPIHDLLGPDMTHVVKEYSGPPWRYLLPNGNGQSTPARDSQAATVELPRTFSKVESTVHCGDPQDVELIVLLGFPVKDKEVELLRDCDLYRGRRIGVRVRQTQEQQSFSVTLTLKP